MDKVQNFSPIQSNDDNKKQPDTKLVVLKKDRVNPHQARASTTMKDYNTTNDGPLDDSTPDQTSKRKISISKIKKIKRPSSVMGVETLGREENENLTFDGKITTVIDKSLFSTTQGIRMPSSGKNGMNSTLGNGQKKSI